MILWIWGLAMLFAIVTFNLPLIFVLAILGVVQVDVQ